MFHAEALEKVYTLDLDSLKKLVMPRYSSTGRPVVNQPEIFRALVLANHYKESISSFVARLKADNILAIACGFEIGNIPGVGSFYDLFNRLWLERTPAKVLQNPYKKKKIKLKAKEKLSPDNPDTVADLVNHVVGGETFEHDPERLLQKVLLECAVKSSAPRWKPVPAPTAKKSASANNKVFTAARALVLTPTPRPIGVGIATMNTGFTDTPSIV